MYVKRMFYTKGLKMKKNDWLQQIETKINNNKNIILVSGASSSGKSYLSNELCKYLQNKNLRCVVISADNYYKGITRTIVENALLKNNYNNNIKSKVKDICKIVKNCIKNFEFTQKMCKKNLNLINLGLKQLFDKNIADVLTCDIKTQFDCINFDEPFSVDLNKLQKDINKLIDNQPIYLPKYSFKTGEVEYHKNNTINPTCYDVIIVEGIYVLRDEIVKKINNNKIIKCAVDCDLKSLLSRKLNRDITKGRSKLSQEQIITTFLIQVMPSYYKYIYPSLSNADIIINSSLSKEETVERTFNQQTKFISSKSIYDYLNMQGAKLIKSSLQNDYYFETNNGNENNNITFRLREENGKLVLLSLKNYYNNKKLERYIEEYDLSNFKRDNNIEFFFNKLVESGFYFSAMVSKQRDEYDYCDKIIKVDRLEEGVFIEIDDFDIKNAKIYKNLVNFNDIFNKSYYDIKLSAQNLSHTEQELKLKIDSKNINEILNEYKHNCYIINQHYLNLNNKNNINFINNFLPKQEDISSYSEARIRIVDNKYCYLTLKSKGDIKRKEFEKQIPVEIFKNIQQLEIIGSVKKQRYDIIKQDNLCVSVDKYLDRDLQIVEIEFNCKDDLSDQKLNKFLNKLKLTDVTLDCNYKNSSLAK